MTRAKKPSRTSRTPRTSQGKGRSDTRSLKSGANTVRIIGGRWRRRKLQFPPIEGLRPTPDRIRETVFNWLAPHLAGATVLDAYCGSGALGLESLSRGAEHCVFIDRSAAVQAQIVANLNLLECTDAQVVQQEFLHWLPTADQTFDLVFLDPPYSSKLLQASLDALAGSPCLAQSAMLYTEHPLDSEPSLTDHWSVIKELIAGSNRYCLLQSTIQR